MGIARRSSAPESVVPIDPLQDLRWSKYLAEHPEADVFCQPQWMRLLARVYGYRPFGLAVMANNEVRGLLPLMEVRSWITGQRGVCLPFSDRCAPVADSPDLGQALVEEAEELGRQRRWDFLEVRGLIPNSSYSIGSRFKRHVLRLNTDEASLFARFKKTQVQQSVTRALREGVKIEHRTDQEAISEFVRLNIMTRRRLGIPPQPDRFFIALQEECLGKGLGFVLLARHRDKVVASAVFLHAGTTLLYKYSASDAAEWAARPNHLLLWEAIRWGLRTGCSILDMGRTDLDHQGLLDFKRAWGAEEEDLFYTVVALGKSMRPPGGRAKKLQPVFKRMPAWMLRTIGKFYGHAG